MSLLALLLLTVSVSSYAMFVAPKALDVTEAMCEDKTEKQKMAIKAAMAFSMVFDVALISFLVFLVVKLFGV
ncbi:MAG: hypothetical protein EBU90_06545 [Proteobacteria bacterium]|nr:hypothetical protein [Pseudomonadota bacterium]